MPPLDRRVDCAHGHCFCDANRTQPLPAKAIMHKPPALQGTFRLL
jgi:hypothetical protein